MGFGEYTHNKYMAKYFQTKGLQPRLKARLQRPLTIDSDDYLLTLRNVKLAKYQTQQFTYDNIFYKY